MIQKNCFRNRIQESTLILIYHEEANFIKENFIKEYNIREISLLPNTEENDEALTLERGEIDFESVDSNSLDQTEKIQSEQYRPNILLDIYRNL